MADQVDVWNNGTNNTDKTIASLYLPYYKKQISIQSHEEYKKSHIRANNRF